MRDGIDRFVAAYNETATPFEWQKREVHQVNLSSHYADLRTKYLALGGTASGLITDPIEGHQVGRGWGQF